jgi:hypothetical protein
MTHKDCYTLPLAVFIDCLVDSNYTGLVIYSEHTADELSEVWGNIYDEYSLLSNNYTYIDYTAKLRDYERAINRLIVLVGGVNVLSSGYDQSVVDSIKLAGFRCNLYTNDLVIYAKGVEDLAKQIHGMNVIVKKLISDLEQMSKKAAGKKATRNDFTKGIAGVSKFMGFRVDPKQCTVAEFVEYQNNLVETLKKQTFTKETK